MPSTTRVLSLLSCLMITSGLSAGERIDQTLAARFFEEAKHCSKLDDGALWGIPLYGPMLLVHGASREIVANQADAEGRLKPQGKLWTGTLPASEIMANMATDWSGERWAMVIWPLPEDPDARTTLMMHEQFHRVQDDLGLPAGNPANAHLDEMSARLWLRLELEALRAALASEGQEPAQHIHNALVFRARRHQLFDGAAAEESALERSEGLAEYTGLVLCDRTAEQITASLFEKIDGAAALPSLVRSLAYVTGPIYGILLDRQGSDWRRQISTEVGLGDLLARQRGITLPAELEQAARARLARYGGEAIRQSESERERRRQERLASYRRQLVDGPVLMIHLQKMKVQFNPKNLQPLGDHGTVYPTLRIADTWGILTVSEAALVDPSWSRVTVPTADIVVGEADGTIEADGWTLELAEGWEIVPGKRTGDLELRPPATESKAEGKDETP